MEGIPLVTVSQRALYALDSLPLVAVPAFIFVGNLMNAAGITDKPCFACRRTRSAAWWPGTGQHLCQPDLSGISRRAGRCVGGLGRIEIRAMRDRGFPLPFSTAVTGASAIIGPIFPRPSWIIIYASVASVSTLQLLVAGILPALSSGPVDADRGDHRAAAKRRAERWPTFGELMRRWGPPRLPCSHR
ncbi:MAG: TRAP transporter large permease subunit [Burkholderiaceae bacterium]